MATREGWAHDAVVLLTEIAGRTERITIGAGVLNVWSRSAGLLAMASASLQEASGGRFVLGLGASSPQLVEGLHDRPFRARRPSSARSSSRPQAPRRPPHRPLDRVGRARPETRPPSLGPRPDLRRRPRSCVDPVGRRDRARAAATEFVAFYLTRMGSQYRTSLTRLGHGIAVAAALSGDRSGLVSGLADSLTVHGTPEQARVRMADWHAAGASMPVLTLPAGGSAADHITTLRALRPRTTAHDRRRSARRPLIIHHTVVIIERE